MASVETNDAVSPANDSGRSSLLTSLMAIVLLLESVLIVGWILKKADYGFDLSDESFYMIWIERPFEYPVSPFQFGSILSLPYKFLHYDLVSFRQFNILTTYMLAFVVAYQLLGPWLRRLDCTLVVRSAVSAAFALPSLTVMTYWLMTPSYNSLNGIAFLLVCVAIFGKCENRASADASCGSNWLWRLFELHGQADFRSRFRRCRAGFCMGSATLVFEIIHGCNLHCSFSCID